MGKTSIPRPGTTKAEIISHYVGVFFAAWGLLAMLTFVPAGLVGISYESKSLFFNTWFLFTLIPSLLYTLVKSPNKIKITHMLADSIEGSLKTIDYYTFNEPKFALALDAESRLVVIASARGARKKPDVKVLPIDIILEARPFDATREEFFNAGTSIQVDMQVASANMRMREIAKKETGLYFFSDDLALDKIFVNLPIRLAERWALAVNKLKAGTLAPTDKSVNMEDLAKDQ